MNRTPTDPAAPPLIGMGIDALTELCRSAGVKLSHAARLNAFIFRHGIDDVDAMPELPHILRDYLRTHTGRLHPEVIERQNAEDGTTKMLLRMMDGKTVETVLIPGPNRLTQCISTQVGCAVGCNFCLTATAGLTRNLSTAEMVAEVMSARKILGEYPRNIVLMGMGEPLHNYEEVARFVRIATDPQGMAFSPRRVTLSTSGLVPGIYRMIEDHLPCNLAVSLNATTDAVRDEIMPINRSYPIDKLMAAVRDYVAARDGKRVLIEYVMLKGVNDTMADAERLIELVGDLGCTVNLLPFNAFADSPYAAPDDETVSAFRQRLIAAGIVAVVRESRGDEISAACGQLKTETGRKRRLA